MKSLARKISQTFVKDSTEITENKVTNTLKKKKSLRDMMVDTFKNPFSYIKNGSLDNDILARNKSINDVRYSTFSRNEYESVFNNRIDPASFSKSDPSKLIYVPKNLMNEDIKDLQSSICESEVFTNNVNDSNTVDSQDFNNISVQAASVEDEKSSEKINEESIESSESTEATESNESTICVGEQISRSDSGYSDKYDTNIKENKSSFFSWRFIKSKISFSKLEVTNFCNDHKLTSYERYENYNSDNETADISEDETAIELQVINVNQNQINEKYLVPEPEVNTSCFNQLTCN